MLSDEIKRTIVNDYRARLTQAEIAKKYNSTQSYIGRIISGKCKPESMSIKNFQKMLPRATINLHGSGDVGGNTVSGNGNAVGHSNYVVNNGPITQSCIDSVMDRILNTSDLTAEEKVKFLSILRK